MSVALMAEVWKLDLSPGEKLVLLSLADQANDEGRQCWPSVETIAKRSGQGVRTVRRALASLEEQGHLTRDHRDGASTQYHVHPCQNGSPAKSAPLPKTTLTPAKMAAKTPRTIIKRERGARVDHELPDDWIPEPFGLGTKSRSIVDGWPPGEAVGQLEHFRAHHRKKADRFANWQAAWSTWVLNSEKFNNGRSNQNIRAGNGTGPDRRSSLARAIDEGIEFLQ